MYLTYSDFSSWFLNYLDHCFLCLSDVCIVSEMLYMHMLTLYDMEVILILCWLQVHFVTVDGRWIWTKNNSLYSWSIKTMGLVDSLAFRTSSVLAGTWPRNFRTWFFWSCLKYLLLCWKFTHNTEIIGCSCHLRRIIARDKWWPRSSCATIHMGIGHSSNPHLTLPLS